MNVRQRWEGSYREWYFAEGRDAGFLSIHYNGDIELAIGKAAYYRQLGSLDGDLPKERKSSSPAILRKMAQVIKWCVDDNGMTLWYEPSDNRRAEIYRRALHRMGLQTEAPFATSTMITIKRRK